ncbi:MAG: hypothetical protein AWM53_02010 [Candidatus Dichloromethanomonas elyunquensis]|nr:MAG: hypothetical protein AWM53_02010 [Candidatus Dichloromethanomonas elyunquensis]
MICSICSGKGYVVVKRFDPMYGCEIDFMKHCSCQSGEPYQYQGNGFQIGSYAEHAEKERRFEERIKSLLERVTI